MSAEVAVSEEVESAGCAAPAALPRLPCLNLKKDNCIINGNYRSVFVAQENIRLYVWKFGEENVGCLTVTLADCNSSCEFQKKWHSFLNGLRKIFPTGMWVRERQPRSGNWHAHAVVNVGWDIKTKFPFDQVRKGFYANVNERLRLIWKQLRDVAESHGFGRIELLPLKYSGTACAAYLTKYLTKAFGSGKLLGEERCRLFSAWGRVRFVHRHFSFLSSRIVQKKKGWLAHALDLPDETHLAAALGTRWWLAIRDSLSQLIMPAEFYMVGSDSDFDFEPIGLRACQTDWPTWPEPPSWDLIQRSRFNLFYDVGLLLFEQNVASAVRFASAMCRKCEGQALSPQLLLHE